jgi:hypothetical protein
MSSELERRLETMFGEAPEPDPGAGAEALHRSLQSLQPAAGSHRGLRTLVVVFATAAVLLAIAAGSLAAAGALHVTLGSKAEPSPRKIPLALPRGANGIAAIVDGKLSVVTKSGFRLQGLPVSAAALSPHALYVAAGIGHSLVALKPNGRQAWSRPTSGKVVKIAWAPDGLRIAYIVADKGGYRWRLNVIWGNGLHDQVIDRLVSPTMPSWRGDSLALAYSARRPARAGATRPQNGARGPLLVYDLAHAFDPIRLRPPNADVARLAFAPRGGELAVDEVGHTLLVGKQRKTVWEGATHGIGWLDGRLAIAAAIPGLPRSGIEAFATHDHLLAAAVPGPRGTLRILAGRVGHLRTVLQVPGKSRCTRHALPHRCAPAIGEDGVQLG